MQQNSSSKIAKNIYRLTTDQISAGDFLERPRLARQELRTFDMEPYDAMAAGGKEVTIRGVGFATDLKKAGHRAAQAGTMATI